MSNLLEIHNLTKTYPGVVALDNFTMDVRQVPGLKNKLVGGEGLFHTYLTGPGRVMLQTMPISSVAAALSGMIPTGN